MKETVATPTSTKLDAALVEKAVEALLKHHQRTVDASEKQQLLGTDVSVQTLLSLEVAPKVPKVKPIRLEIPHPLYKVNDEDDSTDLEEAQVCLIVKEDCKAAIQEQILAFPKHLGCIKKVLGLQSLRTKHASYQQRRDLLARFNVFLADDRILPMLQSALGRDFVRSKKLPIPVRITRKESLPFAIQKALSSTYLHLPSGTCIVLKVGMTQMPIAALVENIVAAAEAAIAHVPRKWANIRSISVKLPASQALPVYNKTPAELQEIAKMANMSTVPAIDAKETKETSTKEAMDKKDDASTPSTSSLSRALKKQKKLENGNKVVETKDKPKQDDGAEKPKKKRNRKETEPAMDTSVPTATKGKKSKTKKEEGAPAAVAAMQDTDKSPAKKAKKSAEMPVAAAAAKQETEKSPSQAKKAKKSAERPIAAATAEQDTDKSPSPAKKAKKSAEMSPTPENFMATKKFQGSKRGYVFKKDKQGLGYYLDVPPIPDKMALQALARMAQKKGKTAGSSAGRNKGKRGRR